MDVDDKIGFGKYSDRAISETPSSYLRWIVENIQNKQELVETVEKELEFRDRFDKHFEE